MAKYIITKSLPIPTYGSVNCNVPSYSKLLSINILSRDDMNLIFESTQMSDNSDSKIFSFNILTGLYQNNTFMDERYVFFDTIRLQESDFIEYYHIFYEEIKSVEELRDDKITDIIEDDLDKLKLTHHKNSKDNYDVDF